MRLIFRPATVNDLPHGIECIRDHFLYDTSAKHRLLAFWRYLLDQQAAVCACVDDLDSTFGRRIVAFGMGVFIHRGFADELRAGEHRYFAMRLVEMWEGGAAPMLTVEEIARANATDGLCMLNLHSGMPNDLISNPAAMPILDQNEAFFHYGLGGYRLNEILLEGYGEFEQKMSVGMRYSIRAGYADTPPPKGVTADPAKRPFLAGITSEEAKNIRGTLLGSMFTYTPPQLRLSAVEQELLLHAFGGNTDDELARTLSVSFATIRKRWDSIYDKVGSNLPSLFAGDPNEPRTGRGGEKRRCVLRYIQFHREELRPYAW